jgi:RNA polymerase-binding transcription factor DksA
MSAAKKKTTAKKVTGRKTAAKKTMARKSPARKATAKKTTMKKTTAKKTTARKATTKKTAAQTTRGKKTTAKKTAVKKTEGSGRAGGRRGQTAGVKKTTAKKTAATKTPVKKALISRKPPVKKTPAPRPARPIKLDAAALAAVKERLEVERAGFERQLRELESDSFNESQSEISGDAGLNEDFADAGTATFDRERDLSIRNNVLDLIDTVTRALQRIDDGTYGTCERCGKPIDAARIKAFPRVLLCLDCKRREERIR